MLAEALPLARRHRQPALPAARHAARGAPARRGAPVRLRPRDATSGRSSSALCIFAVGGAFSIYEGVAARSLRRRGPRRDRARPCWAFVVLGASILLESYSLHGGDARVPRTCRAGAACRATLARGARPDGAHGAVRGSRRRSSGLVVRARRASSLTHAHRQRGRGTGWRRCRRRWRWCGGVAAGARHQEPADRPAACPTGERAPHRGDRRRRRATCSRWSTSARSTSAPTT